MPKKILEIIKFIKSKLILEYSETPVFQSVNLIKSRRKCKATWSISLPPWKGCQPKLLEVSFLFQHAMQNTKCESRWSQLEALPFSPYFLVIFSHCRL